MPTTARFTLELVYYDGPQVAIFVTDDAQALLAVAIPREGVWPMLGLLLTRENYDKLVGGADWVDVINHAQEGELFYLDPFKKRTDNQPTLNKNAPLVPVHAIDIPDSIKPGRGSINELFELPPFAALLKEYV